MAFLAIPGVDPGTGARTLSQIICYLSIVTSLGCLVTGLVLLRHHGAKQYDTAEEIVSCIVRSAALISSLTVTNVPCDRIITFEVGMITTSDSKSSR